jgi:hypothetical protein
MQSSFFPPGQNARITTLSMRVNISKAYQSVLLHRPIHTPILVSLEKPEETALAVRVHNLFSFRRQGIPVTAKPIGYQGREGTWVVAVAFGIVSTPAAPVTGAAYLNPRQVDDYRLLQHLAKQEQLPFFFLSPRLKVAVRQGADWSLQHRQEVRMLLARMDHSLPDKRQNQSMDPDFEQAKRELQSRYPTKTLLAGYPQGEVWVSSALIIKHYFV